MAAPLPFAALAESALALAIFGLGVGAGSTNLGQIVARTLADPGSTLSPGHLLAFASLFIVMLAETGRLAVAAVLLIRQASYKRMLAYSSVEHIGLMCLGFGLGATGCAARDTCSKQPPGPTASWAMSPAPRESVTTSGATTPSPPMTDRPSASRSSPPAMSKPGP
jgi:hypothetical protein